MAETLHDGLLEPLRELHVKAATLLRLEPASLYEQRAWLGDLATLAQSAVAELEQIVRGLADGAARRSDLLPRLIELCECFRSNCGIRCETRLQAEHVRFTPAASECVYQAIRELLANVHLHSHASRVEITSERRGDGSVAIGVHDDGVGMPPQRMRPNPFDGGGLGLWRIEQRLAEVGGTLSIDSNAGVRATVVVPARFAHGAR